MKGETSSGGNTKPFFWGVVVLASGAFLLLLFPSLLWLTRSESWAPVVLLPALAYPALALEIAAWVRLSRAAPETRVRRRFLPWSVMSLAIGFGTIPLLLPGWFAPPGRWQFLFLGMFLYLPTVLGPVVCVHALLFLAAAKSFRHRLAFALSAGGAVALVAITAGGVAYQVLLLSSPLLPEWLFAFNGLAGFGYALLASGVRVEFGHSPPFP